MTVVVAPDSFKGTFSAPEVASAIAAGIRDVGGDAVEVPLADGGEGTLDALARPLHLTRVVARVSNPWGQEVAATYGISPDGLAVIESAAAIGLHVPHDGVRDPVTASSRGIGELVAHAVEHGARQVVLGLGGSGTSDGGRGAIDAIDDLIGDRRVTMRLLVDVSNTYLDAARVFARQKGATVPQVAEIEECLVLGAASWRKDPTDVWGSGAAGGLAGGLWARYDATIESGADFVVRSCGMNKIAGTTAFVTGEGRLDGQSRNGKLVSSVVQHAAGVPVHAVVGSLGNDLGHFRDAFATVTTAPDLEAMRLAGREIGRLTKVRSLWSSGWD